MGWWCDFIEVVKCVRYEPLYDLLFNFAIVSTHALLLLFGISSVLLFVDTSWPPLPFLLLLILALVLICIYRHHGSISFRGTRQRTGCVFWARLGLQDRYGKDGISGENTGLLRPLGFMESGVATAHSYGSSNIVYALRMFSRRPLQPELVKQTLVIMQRRVQNLRLCIRQLYGRRYFAEMQQQRVLFDVRHCDSWMQEYESQLQAVFDVCRGPLWCAVLITMPEANAANTTSKQKSPTCSASSNVSVSARIEDKIEEGIDNAISKGNGELHRAEDATPGFTHMTMLVLNFCHAISDGASNAIFCDMFLSILNRLIAGQTVVDAPDLKLQPALEEMKLRTGGGLSLKQIAKTAGHLWSLAFPPVNRYLASFPTPPKPTQIRMRTYSMVLGLEDTRKLMAACRRESVTVHAAFTVAASVALYQIIRQRANSDDQIEDLNVRSGHVVNFRRYLQPPTDQRDIYGCYMGFFEADVDVDSNSEEPNNFWAIARRTGERMRCKLDTERQPVTYCQLMQSLLSTERWVRRQHTKDMPHVSHYFGTSNMGNLDRLFNASGDHVEVTQLVRTTNIGHDLGMVFAHMFHTLRGRLMYNLDYLVSAVTEVQAQQYAEATLRVIKSISRE